MIGGSLGLVASFLLHSANKRKKVFSRPLVIAYSTFITTTGAFAGIASCTTSSIRSVMELSKDSNLKKQLYTLIIEFNPTYSFQVLERNKEALEAKNNNNTSTRSNITGTDTTKENKKIENK